MDKILAVDSKDSVAIDKGTQIDLDVMVAATNKTRVEIVKEAIEAYTNVFIKKGSADGGARESIKELFGEETTHFLDLIAQDSGKDFMTVAKEALDFGIYGMTIELLKNRQPEHKES